MASGGSFQRVFQLFWDKDLDNTDYEVPITVLGKTYLWKPEQSDEQSITSPLSDANGEPSTASQSQESSISDIRNIWNGLKIGGTGSSDPKRRKDSSKWPADFTDDVYTRIWLTYRTRFAPINRDPDGPSPLSLSFFLRGQNYDLTNEYFTTDCGWGCMIRTAQTLLANALLSLHLGREWRFTEESNQKHDEIVSWFIDCPSHPFSIHRIVDKGRLLSNKKAGEWFGPSAAARSIQALCNEFDSGLKVHIGSDSGDIYENDVFKVAKDEDGVFKPVLILLGVRLGVESINKLYWESLKSILQSSVSVGISGGRPSTSHYFFGFQGDYLFYLDPHLPQPALLHEDKLDNSVSESTEIVSSLDVQSVHTKKLRKIHLSEVDPSMLLGFLIKDEDEWLSWKQTIQDSPKKNSVIRISPDHTPRDFSNRKPSFVVYDENGDDFVDVGLEYEELPEETPQPEEEYEQITKNETVSAIPETADIRDRTGSVVVVSTEEYENPIKESITEESPEVVESTGPYENYPNSIKDDYENVGNASSTNDTTLDQGTKESEYEEEDTEPYVVETPEVRSLCHVTVNTILEEGWESSHGP